MFPTESPYRIDQVVAAPGWMAALFLAQVMMASLMSGAVVWKQQRIWAGAAMLLLAQVALFFTLASWGTSDPTKLSHDFEHYLGFGVNGEPLWWGLGPVVRLLPYRMAAVQGMVAAGFAAAPLLLARRWGVPAWGGWWSLLIVCSPLLRGFLQNSHTRQALAVLLLLPVFLWAAQLARFERLRGGLALLLSALAHTTFPLNLGISLAPLLVRAPGRGGCGGERWRALAQWHLRTRLLVLLAALVLLLLAGLLGPILMQKFFLYRSQDYFNTYSLRKVVGRLQWAIAGGVVLAALQKRLNPRQLLGCQRTRLLMLFGLLYIAVQASIQWEWLPQATSRLADAVGFFLLISLIAWLHYYQANWYVLPALIVTLIYWFDDRILASANLVCGRNDSFLCVPDRWPWLMRY